jgi:hypothetical protein
MRIFFMSNKIENIHFTSIFCFVTSNKVFKGATSLKPLVVLYMWTIDLLLVSKR